MKTITISPLRAAPPALFVSALLVLTGCQSVIQPPKTTVELAKEQITAINGVSGSIHSLEQGVTKDPEATAQRIAALEQKIAQGEARLAAIVEEANSKNQKLKEKIGDITGDVTQIAAAFSGLGPIVPGLLTATTAALRERVEKVDDRLKETVQKEVTGLRDEVAKKVGEQIRLNETQMAQYRAEIVAAAKERGLSEAEIAKLQGMSDAELLGLLGGGGGLAGLALTALLRTYGKSRSQGEIDQLWDKIDEVKDKVAQK